MSQTALHVVNAVCVDYSAAAHFPARSSALIDGLPGDDLVSRPATLSACELEKLHTECVARINKYRSGALKFSDGTDDSNVAAGLLEPLEEATGTNECSSQQAFGDLLKNVDGGGGCAGAHHTAGTCPSQGGWAQNSCCGRGGGSFGNNNVIATYEAVRDELFGCLQGMWDEGIKVGPKGHWETMRSPNYQVAHCGFAFTASGRLMANQDFAPKSKSSYLPCSCSGKPAGADDGCGGACVACSDPTQPACADDMAAMTLLALDRCFLPESTKHRLHDAHFFNVAASCENDHTHTMATSVAWATEHHQAQVTK